MSEPQDNPAPRRRWYQFKLGTWFVLVAILGWEMAIQPKTQLSYSSGTNDRRAVLISVILDGPEAKLPPQKPAGGYDNCFCRLFISSKPSCHYFDFAFSPKAASFPILAVAAFVAWKVAWLIVERRHANRAATR